MNATHWRSLGYTVLFKHGFVYLYYPPTRGTFTQPIDNGKWMDRWDDWRRVLRQTQQQDVQAPSPHELAAIATACYCASLSGSTCDYCGGIRTPEPIKEHTT